MTLKVYNSLKRAKEDFEPIHPGKVGMYVCGVTVYDMCHIGHARSLVVFDVVYRYLKYRGYETVYVRNFTDVDDKIINRANERGENWKDLAERFIREFHTDTDALGLERPDHEPKATEHIDRIISLVEKLIERGHAYEVQGDVMFSVESFEGYGKLSGKKIDELQAGSRVGVDAKKRNPLDFALWKASKPGEPWWDSPWGRGRPGWHIECSAMSSHYLGDTFDIHGGGADLAFPHHENEIAQSRAATGEPFAKYWIHNGFVNIRSEKMSKSLGNVLNIREALERSHPEVLRLFLLSKHYRSPLDYNENSIKEAGVGLERLYWAVSGLNDLIAVDGKINELPEELSSIRERFIEAMDDDFNTPRALAILFEAARGINRMTGLGTPSKKKTPRADLLLQAKSEMIETASTILGLLVEEPERFLVQLRRRRVERLGLTEEYVENKIAERAEARKNKDFARSDAIRDELAEKDIILEDTPSGTVWRVKAPGED